VGWYILVCPGHYSGFDRIDLQSGNILFDVQAHEYPDPSMRGSNESTARVDGQVCIPSEPFVFTETQPVNIKITDFGVGSRSPLVRGLIVSKLDR